MTRPVSPNPPPPSSPTMAPHGSPHGSPPASPQMTGGFVAQDQSTIHNHTQYPQSPVPLSQEIPQSVERQPSRAGESDMAGVSATRPPAGFGENTRGTGWSRVSGNAFFFATFTISFLAWVLALIAQSLSTAKFSNASIGTLWPALVLQLVTTILLINALHSGNLPFHLNRISHFTTILIVLGAIGIDRNIFSGAAQQQAVAAAWVLLVIVDGLWLIVSTAEGGSIVWRLVEKTGNIPLGMTRPISTAPVSVLSQRGGVEPVAMEENGGRGYDAAPASVAGGDGSERKSAYPPSTWTDNKGRDSVATAGNLSQNISQNISQHLSQGRTQTPTQHSLAPTTQQVRSSVASTGGTDSARPLELKAVALFSYTANSTDPNEISFQKEEVMEVLDKSGKWWEIRKEDGSIGIAPSNYLRIL
ncbi:hypothetical protein BDN72DRAFT_65579 [Pluteus cervinus]|uniref:Uncharacterized protein n=1 Tax=Pluteus cervinus TaxID=181527 RepID=A0ACD3AR73_9AGAR|nr:hypothetical protein BDN72DRAFT_65579 [Pluteus cervinus]